MFLRGGLADTFRSVTFTQKLAKLTNGKNKAAIARAADLQPTLVNAYVNKGYMPGADIALRLARVLAVPVEWLIDDAADWPPPEPLEDWSTARLAAELGKRLRPHGNAMLGRIGQCERADWVKIARELLPHDPDQPLPKRLADVIVLPAELNGDENELRRIEPRFAIGEDAPPDTLKTMAATGEVGLLDLHIRHRNLDDEPCYEEVFRLASFLKAPKHYRTPWFGEQVEWARNDLRRAIEDAERAAAEKAAAKRKAARGKKSGKSS